MGDPGSRIAATLLTLILLGSARSAQPLPVFEGDGVTIRVLTLSDDEESVTGEVTTGNATHPFTARLTADGDAAIYRGTFRDGNESVAFTATQREGDAVLVFAVRGRRYRLRAVQPQMAKPAPAPLENAPPTPKTPEPEPPASRAPTG